jgi:hypothetical protein
VSAARWSPCIAQWPDVIKDRAKAILLDLKVVSRLEIQPESVRRPEEAGKTQGRISGDAPLAMDDLVDSPRRNSNLLSQPILAER